MTGSTWNMADDSTLTELKLLNNSKVYLNSDPAAVAFIPRTLTITGDFTGNNGTLIFNTELKDDLSLTDKLDIQGDSYGNTKVQVRNAGGSGAETLDGIELISVGGNSNGEFTKDGRIVAGAYEYFIGRGNGVTTNSKNWYLTSKIIPPTPIPPAPPTTPVTPAPVPNPDPNDPVIPLSPISIFRPESGSYIANNAAVNTLFLHRLHDRLGESQYTDSLLDKGLVSSIWVRNVGGYNTFKDGSDQLKTKSKNYVLQVGGDIAQWSTNGTNRYHFGLMGGYALNHNKTESNITDYYSKGEAEGYNIGVYGTWYSNKEDRSGLYADSWLIYNWFNNKVNGEDLDEENYNSKGITASLESGYTFRIDNKTGKTSYYIQPKAQIVYMGVKTEDHTESNGTIVEFMGDGNIQTRLGIRTYSNSSNLGNNTEKREFQPFIELNWIHNTKDFEVIMDGAGNNQNGAKNLGEIKLGAEVKLSENFDIWGNLAYQLGSDEYQDTQAVIGLKYRF